MKIEYFIAEEKHFNELAHLRFLFKSEKDKTDHNFISEYVDYLKRETKLSRLKVFCANYKETIIANMNLILIPKSPKPGSNDMYLGYITNSFVLNDFRNHGIGTHILELIDSYSKENFVELLFVWPSDKSVKYYCRAGFNENNEILEKIIFP